MWLGAGGGHTWSHPVLQSYCRVSMWYPRRAPATYRRSASWRLPSAPAVSRKSPPASPGAPPGSRWARWPSAPLLPPPRGNGAPGLGGGWPVEERSQEPGSRPSTHLPQLDTKSAGTWTTQPGASPLPGASLPRLCAPHPRHRSCDCQSALPLHPGVGDSWCLAVWGTQPGRHPPPCGVTKCLCPRPAPTRT